MRFSLSFLGILLLPFAFSCKSPVNQIDQSDTARVDGHPAWIMQGNIYEVNVRQYTPEGTFRAFAKHLDRLKAMGVQTLWFMPINPISKTDRKGSLGSYYAVSDYTAVNPEYGNLDDWIALVKQCHSMGFKVIIDWVPNHTGADHYWLKTHPDFYVRDSSGNPVSQFDWSDTRKLNYANPALRDTMINDMEFWVNRTGIDGFRCDYAVGPTLDFWKECVKQLKAKKNLFLLAETDSAWLYKAGFDATYAWPEFGMMKQIAAGKRKASAMDSVFRMTDTTLPANGLRLFFTSNHDENSWNQADFGTMPGPSHAPFAVLTQTMYRGIPLVYSGQEEPVTRAIRFFDKDTIQFEHYARADFYSTLLHLHSSSAALAADARFVRLPSSKDDQVYAYARLKGNEKVVVILNLSDKPAAAVLNNVLVEGVAMEVFEHKKDTLAPGETFRLPAWGYKVYRY
ncbi:MAG TPA: alpha-amylase family glycosyl hydrolase [Sediminibacterium sp.]|nr:alpha-amylase family glycosyl hydrolase [Sediminibacterium sp.]